MIWTIVQRLTNRHVAGRRGSQHVLRGREHVEGGERGRGGLLPRVRALRPQGVPGVRGALRRLRVLEARHGECDQEEGGMI